MQFALYSGIVTFILLFIINYKEYFKKINSNTLGRIHTAFVIYIFAFAITKLINSGIPFFFATLFSTCRDYIVFLWLVFHLNDDNKKLFKRAILIAGLVAVFYGVMQLIGFDVFDRQVNPHRISGFHKNAYTYGGQLIVIFFFFFNEWIIRWVKPVKSSHDLIFRFFYLFLVFVCFYCVLNTSERAVIFGVIAGIVVYVLLSWKSSLYSKLLFPALVLITVPVIFTVIFNRGVFKRFKKIFIPSDLDNINVRFRLWDIAIFTWKKNLLFGKGEYPVVYHQATIEQPVQLLTHAHNVYLQLLVTNGLIGLLSFINLIGMVLIHLFKRIAANKMALCLISIIIALLVEGIFEFNWGDVEVRYLFLYFMGYVFSLEQAREKQSSL